MKESWESEVIIPHTSYQVFLALLEYLYTDSLPQDRATPELAIE